MAIQNNPYIQAAGVAAVTFVGSLLMGQLVAPKAVDQKTVEELIEKHSPYTKDKPAIQVQFKNMDDRLDRIEDKLDRLILLQNKH